MILNSACDPLPRAQDRGGDYSGVHLLHSGGDLLIDHDDGQILPENQTPKIPSEGCVSEKREQHPSVAVQGPRRKIALVARQKVGTRNGSSRTTPLSGSARSGAGSTPPPPRLQGAAGPGTALPPAPDTSSGQGSDPSLQLSAERRPSSSGRAILGAAEQILERFPRRLLVSSLLLHQPISSIWSRHFFSLHFKQHGR